MELKRLLSLTRQAIDEYKMIEEGDRLAVGISGGKDSITLLYALNSLRRFYPKKFDIEAITIDVGLNMDFSPVKKLCDDMEVNYTIVKTEIQHIVFDEMKDKNPCFMCAKMRKGAFNEMAKSHGCNRIAYGHHKDDFVTTFLMSAIYEGRVLGLEPVTYLDKSELTLIRPLMYVNESEIIGFSNKYDIQLVKNECPADGNTKREYTSELLRQINRENPGARDRIFTAWINQFNSLHNINTGEN